MNTRIIALYFTAQMVLTNRVDRMKSEMGQTSVEWLGIASVVGLILVVLLKNAKGWGGDISDGIDNVIQKVSR